MMPERNHLLSWPMQRGRAVWQPIQMPGALLGSTVVQGALWHAV